MLIGICGYARVGKDTAAEGLKNFEKFSFATNLKDEVNIMLNSVLLDEVDMFEEEDKMKWREFLVFWGALRRRQAADYWVRMLDFQLKMSPFKNKVITDVRYLNEVRYILDNGGYIIRLHRPGYKPANEEEHMSFAKIDNWLCSKTELWDKLVFRIDNDSSIEHLHEGVKTCLKRKCQKN